MHLAHQVRVQTKASWERWLLYGKGTETSKLLWDAVTGRFPSISQAAEACGISNVAMWYYLHGRMTPRLRAVPLLAAKLGCDAHSLMAAVIADRQAALKNKLSSEMMSAVTADRMAGDQSEDGQAAGACAQSVEGAP